MAESMLPLRPLLLLLVLTNIAFVHLTGAMGPLPTTLLTALALAAPWLRRLQGRRGYQLLWNGSVVVIFALLLQHAVSTGLLHMLEDGLLLAALCQVHLLNNLGPRQRPDLLFFNSFLIAFITSFFSQDVSWSVAFFGYVVTLVPALQLYIALPRRQPASRPLVRAVLRDALRHTAVAVAVTAAVFAFWPRDFHRQGWLQDHLDLSQLTGMQAGFSEEIRLDRAGVASTSDRVVLRIAPQHGDPSEVPTHWRGATLTDFDGTSWTADPVDHQLGVHRADEPWQRHGDHIWRRGQPGVGGVLQVRVVDSEVDRAFLPPAATEFEFSPRLAVDVEPRADGTVSWTRTIARNRRSLPPGYQVRCGASDRQRAPAISDLARRRLLQLGPLELPPPLLALARDLRQQLPRNARPAEIAESMRLWLAANRRYALPGSPEAALSLHEFLLGHGGGHCELFAATLALLLRVQGIPCRIVTGYLASEWHAAASEVVVRRRDAHAWVEVLLPGEGWVTCDATPAAGQREPELAAGSSWWSQIEARARSMWAVVTGFDAEQRSRVLAFLLQLPLALVAACQVHAGATGMALLLLASWWCWRRWRRQPRHRSVRALRRAVRRARLRWLPGETPRELLRRATAQPLAAGRLDELRAAAAAHERQRYAAPLLAAMLLVPFARGQRPPIEARLVPAAGSVDVDWQLKNLEVRFDRDMVMTSCAFGGSGTTLPRISTSEWLDPRTLRLSVVLDPESVYALELSGVGSRGLGARDGARLPPLSWQFCTTSTAPTPEPALLQRNQRAYELLLAVVRDHYAYRDRTGIDWPAQFERHRERVLAAPSLAALALATAGLMAVAQDPHVTVQFGKGTLPTMLRAVQPNVRPELLTCMLPGLQQIDRHLAVARTADGIGYLQLNTFRRDERDSVDRALDTLRTMRDCKGIVVDVRQNAGGDEAVARQLAAWFVPGQHVYAAHTRRNVDSPGGFDPRQDRVIRGNAGADRYDGPVAVLTGPMLMSSAESFLLMMRQDGKVRLVGATSYGSSGDCGAFTLAPGLAVLLPILRVLRPDGTCIEGDGIEPDIGVATEPQDLARRDPVLSRALEYLRAQ